MALLPHVRPGDPISAARFNQLIDTVNSLASFSVTPPLIQHKGPGGIQIALSGGISGLKHGKLDDNLVFGSTAVCSIWTGTVNAETDSGANEIVACFLLNAGESIAATSKVTIAMIDGKYYVISRNCPV